VLAVDGQLEDMLRQLRIVRGNLDLVLVGKRTLQLWILLSADWTLDAVVCEAISVSSHSADLTRRTPSGDLMGRMASWDCQVTAKVQTP